jgi:hypothetical protein
VKAILDPSLCGVQPISADRSDPLILLYYSLDVRLAARRVEQRATIH